MKKTYIIFGAVLIVVLGFLFFGMEEKNEEEVATPDSELAEYFGERIFNLGTADGLIPIEGFDANLLMGEFPALKPGDFEGVEAFEGHYEVRGGEIAFVRENAQPVSSAERTVSTEGYGTLLENLADRLGIKVEDGEDVEEILSIINTREIIKARIDQRVSVEGHGITVHEVLEDSRCPIDVECIQAGTVRVRTTLESGLGTSEQVFELFTEITTETGSITLTRIEPQQVSGDPIEPEEYVFYFEVEKRIE